jgi:hypothetical protein
MMPVSVQPVVVLWTLAPVPAAVAQTRRVAFVMAPLPVTLNMM